MNIKVGNVYQGLVSVAINHESKVSNWHVSPFLKLCTPILSLDLLGKLTIKIKL